MHIGRGDRLLSNLPFSQPSDRPRDLDLDLGSDSGRLSCAVQTLHFDALDRQRYGTSLPSGTRPTYSQVDSRRNLRSSDNCTSLKLRTLTKFAERAFCISGPAAWNALPTEPILVQCKDTFKRRLLRRFILI